MERDLCWRLIQINKYTEAHWSVFLKWYINPYFRAGEKNSSNYYESVSNISNHLNLFSLNRTEHKKYHFTLVVSFIVKATRWQRSVRRLLTAMASKAAGTSGFSPQLAALSSLQPQPGEINGTIGQWQSEYGRRRSGRLHLRSFLTLVGLGINDKLYLETFKSSVIKVVMRMFNLQRIFTKWGTPEK